MNKNDTSLGMELGCSPTEQMPIDNFAYANIKTPNVKDKRKFREFGTTKKKRDYAKEKAKRKMANKSKRRNK